MCIPVARACRDREVALKGEAGLCGGDAPPDVSESDCDDSMQIAETVLYASALRVGISR